MKIRLARLPAFGRLLFAGTQDSDINVNTRYTVDTVTVAGKGWKTDLVSDQGQNQKMSSGLRKDLAAMIGQKLNPSALDSLAARAEKELVAREVSHRVLRGDSPEHVRVEFDVKQYSRRNGRQPHEVRLQLETGVERGRRRGAYLATELLPVWHGERRRLAR